MKKLILASFILINSICHASNLEFNQVILIDGNVAFSQTVPNGKVWEIKSLAPDGLGDIKITVNGRVWNVVGTSSSHSYNALPLWLPAGSVLSGTGSGTDNLYSIIEYNVVP